MEIENCFDSDFNFYEESNYSNNFQMCCEDNLHEQESYFSNISSENYNTTQYNETETFNTSYNTSFMNSTANSSDYSLDSEQLDYLPSLDDGDSMSLPSLSPCPDIGYNLSTYAPITSMQCTKEYKLVYESKELKRPKIFKQKTCIHDNLPCTDNQSFLFNILYHICNKSGYLHDYNENYLLQYKNRINDNCLSYPVNPLNIEMLKEFEIVNNIGINIFGMKNEDEKIELLYHTSFFNHNNNNIVNVLYYEKSRMCRYFYIKFLKTIVGMMNNDSNMKNKQVCPNCVKIFDTALKYRKHLQI